MANLVFTISFDADAIMEKVEEARQWLGDTILSDCNMYAPQRTGHMRETAYFDLQGSEVIWPADYSSDVYYAEEHGYTIHTDKNPMATSHWIEHATADYEESWYEGVKDILGG